MKSSGYIGRWGIAGIARLDLLRYFPFIDTELMRRIELEQLGTINQPTTGTGMRGGEQMLQRPPEGVLRGESIFDRKTEQSEMKELYLKAKESRIKSLERQERLKKEVEINE